MLFSSFHDILQTGLMDNMNWDRVFVAVGAVLASLQPVRDHPVRDKQAQSEVR
jgi:hypothetical protein